MTGKRPSSTLRSLCFPGPTGPQLSTAGSHPNQDNARYHKDGETWDRFDANRQWLEVYQLPSYSPELNPTE
jgi:transposase